MRLRQWPQDWTNLVGKFVSDEQNEFCLRIKDGERGQWYYGRGKGCTKPLTWVPQETIPLHQWVHIACVRKLGQSGQLYINGVLQGEKDWGNESGATPTEAPVRLMVSSRLHQFLDGQLSEVRVWKVARTGDEIRGKMCEPLTEGEPGLVAVWSGSEDGSLVDLRGQYQGQMRQAAAAGTSHPRVGVCSCEVSQNGRERADTLAQLYGGFAQVELISGQSTKSEERVSQPNRETEISYHTIQVEDEEQFLDQALGLVLAHPYEVVHLSKPGMPNVILGLLYKLLWDARVIVDIDDEELSSVEASEPLDLGALLSSGGQLPPLLDLLGQDWTRIAVSLARAFDGVTVSNVALQERYGGVVIRHARDEGWFVPSADLKRRSRERLGIAQDKWVVLFLGTLEEHKTLVATAQALASLGRKDVVLAIIGDYPDGKLQEELQGIAGVDYVFVENQPFESIPDVVAAGDICILLQDVGSDVSQFQIPAKLSDALGMGLVVLLSETAAVADVIESGAVVPVAEGDLAAVLGRLLSDQAECDQLQARGQELFAAEFGFGVNGPRLVGVVDGICREVGVLSDELNLLFAGLPGVDSVWSRLGGNNSKAQIIRTNNVEVLETSKIENNSVNSTFYEGRVEGANSDFIHGWAVDTKNLNKDLILDIYVDNILINSCKANRFRKDLAEKFNSSGHHGFKIEVPKSLMFKNKIVVNVKLRDTSFDIRYSPVNILVGSPGKQQKKRHKYRNSHLVKSIYKNHETANNITPKVAMIILNLNGALVLENLFASFQIYNTYTNIEIIVVDHNSSDDSVKKCKFWSKYLPIKTIERDANYSFSDSNNLAANQSDAPLLFFVNNDMMFCQDIIPELVRVSQHKTVGIVGLKLLDVIDGDRYGFPSTQHLGIQFNLYTKNRAFVPYDIRYSSHLLDINYSAWLVPSVTGAAMMCKRDDFINVGGFDEGYFYGYEDVDLCLLFQQKLKKNIVCVNNLAMFHYRGLTRFNNHSTDFNIKRSKNKEYLEKRFGYYVRRCHLLDLFNREIFWTSSPLRIGFAVTEASLEASAGDYFTAFELGENLAKEFGWEVFYISQKDKNWYDVSSLDVLIVMRDDYDLNQLKNCKSSLVKVIWIRNWFERLINRPWVSNYDLIWASSHKAVKYLEEKLAKPVLLMPIATNSQRFQEAEFESNLASDYCFTGSYWNSPREIIDLLEPDNLPFNFALYGYNWDNLDKFKKYNRGPLPYTKMSNVYASTKIVVDDANIVTKEWGSVNSRVFDALTTGALVITNGRLGSEYMFNGFLPTYDSKESLNNLLTYYLSNESARLELVKKLQAIVNEQNTYKHRAYTAFESLKRKIISTFRISIKIGVPRWEVVEEWGDYHFALAMKRAFERKGHSVRIDILPEWDTPKNYGDDVVIVLRGLSEYNPKPYNINLMWNISHPDKVYIHEYEKYDHVFIASLSYAEELRQKLQIPVETLLQCTDPEIFYPDIEGKEEVGEVLFVGNSRKVYRKIVKDAIQSGIKVNVYGTNWENFISREYLKGYHIPNNILRRYYTRAGILLNDHWETMSRYGFLSNRLFDAAACGATIISDSVSGLEEVFGNHIITYSSGRELATLIPEVLKSKEFSQEKKLEFSQNIRNNHSFQKRIENMLETIEKLHYQKMKGQANEKFM
ncbi:MAG: glycosyltransferase [Ectothiorhodospiraceae bacterium]|nr:glycosyltransferase [Ectothiorhodospiraceae bacterium]